MIAQITPLYIKTRPAKVISRLMSYAFFEGRPLTTSGRWINPLVFTHFAIVKRLPQLKKVKKPIFIIGSGRSGTTILGMLMSIHRDVGFLNEPKALWHSIYPEEDVIGNYSRGQAYYLLSADDATERVRQYAHRLFGMYLFAVASSRLVDKYPELIFRIPFVKAIFPDAKFIFLTRNGWATCASINLWSKQYGNRAKEKTHDWWGLNNRKWTFMVEQLVKTDFDLKELIGCIEKLDNHLDMTAVEWIVTMKEGLRQKSLYSDCIHMLKYEQLVQEPRKVLIELLGFCELKNDEVFFKYAERQLKPVPAKNTFKINPIILPLFEKTMKEMGY
ncbi:MAG: sulfotransferase [Candidatus Brocadia sp.]|nr:sulfotransferase [Candidatus Brocadia sp.]